MLNWEPKAWFTRPPADVEMCLKTISSDDIMKLVMILQNSLQTRRRPFSKYETNARLHESVCF